MLPVERLLAGEPRYSPRELAERSGVPLEVLQHQWRSIGVAIDDPDLRSMSAEDLDAAHRQRALLDAGLDPDSIAEMGRTIAVAMSQFAAGSRQIMATTFTQEGDTERERSDRILEQVRSLIPLVGPTLEYVYRLHLREQLRHTALGAGEPREGSSPGRSSSTSPSPTSSGSRRLGEELPPEELGRVTGRLDELAREVAKRPGPAGQADRRRGDALLTRCERPARGHPRPRRQDGRGGGGLPDDPRRRGPRHRPQPRRRLLRRPGQPREPRDRRRQARQRPRHRATSAMRPATSTASPAPAAST